MQAILSAKVLKAALKTVKTVIETYDREDPIYGLFNINSTLCLVGISGGLFATYTLGPAADDLEGFVALDHATLSSLKFPDDIVAATTTGQVLQLRSLSLEVELLLPRADKWSFKSLRKDPPRTYAFNTKAFLAALDFHTYGAHHNPQEAARRLVRLTSGEGKLKLLSFDKQVSAVNYMPFSGDLPELYIPPKPVAVILNCVAEDVVSFGVSEKTWYLETSSLKVSYPNVVKPLTSNLDRVIAEMDANKGRMISFRREHLAESMNMLTPSIKAGREENPRMHFYVRPGEKTKVTIASERIRSMSFELEGVPQGISDTEAIGLNFRYTKEFVENLIGDNIHFQYWTAGEESPLRGRALSFYVDGGRYIIGRLTL